jgi:hypothetical protein
MGLSAGRGGLCQLELLTSPVECSRGSFPVMLPTVWFKLRRPLAADPTSNRGIGFAGRSVWFRRQLRLGPTYRLFYSYNVILGLTGGLSLLCGKLLWPAWLGSHSNLLGHSLLNVLLGYIQDVLLANAILVGAIIVRGPLASDTLDFSTELAQRLDPEGGAATEIRPAHGAILMARVTIIGPTPMLLGLVLAQRQLGRFMELIGIACLLLAAISVVGAVVGISAVFVRRMVRHHAVWVWFGLWTAPEVLRLMIPHLATPRSIVEASVALASCGWGNQ